MSETEREIASQPSCWERAQTLASEIASECLWRASAANLTQRPSKQQNSYGIAAWTG